MTKTIVATMLALFAAGSFAADAPKAAASGAEHKAMKKEGKMAHKAASGADMASAPKK